MKRLPTALAGPVNVALAKPAEVIPAEPAMSGGSVYELTWDGCLRRPDLIPQLLTVNGIIHP